MDRMGERKKIKEKIEALKEQKKLHEEKIRNYDGKDYTIIPYWEKEIESFERQIEEEEEKLEE